MKIVSHEIGKDELFKIWHSSPIDQNMIIYMHSDGGSIVSRENIYPIKPGVLCFVGARKYHYTMPDVPEQYDRSKLFFSADILAKTLDLISDGRHFSGFTPDSLCYAEIPEDSREKVVEIFSEIAAAYGASYYTATVISCLVKLLVLIDRYALKSSEPVMGSLGGAIKYINRNIFHEIDIDEICASIHMSKYHFCRIFKKSMGMTVMDYILKTRIILAKNMLDKENVSVTEVSERCGFSSVSYFCRIFKNNVGVSPLQYRKNVNGR